MKTMLDKLAKRHIMYPFRKVGLFASKHWPFPVQATLCNGDSMWVDLRSSIGRAILVKGEFDHGVWLAMEPYLGAGSVFLDVGANVGYYSMLAARVVGEGGQVHAFEIDPRPLRCLKRNARECAYHNVIVHEVAASDFSGRSVLVPGTESGHSFISRNGNGMTVNTISLDAWIETDGMPSHVDVIKLDIEGGELAALEGARALIARYRPLIVCEALDNVRSRNEMGQERLLGFFTSVGYSTRFLPGVHSPTLLAAPRG